MDLSYESEREGPHQPECLLPQESHPCLCCQEIWCERPCICAIITAIRHSVLPPGVTMRQVFRRTERTMSTSASDTYDPEHTAAVLKKLIDFIDNLRSKL